MFDIGLWEMIVIAILGLVVLGPERLPTAVRTVTTWYRTIKRMADNVKQELSHELEIDKLHSDLRKAEQFSQDINDQSMPKELKESVTALQDAAQDVQRPYQKTAVSTDAQTQDNK